ncbi:exodeoxyribonuclease V subunit gamma [Psychromonas sp. CNPT3]|uniref:exodeoxyribonuclease V subunit gamma n=1 Tax=Psychromonas sp. CNPT3 TaxID=314282 RepID=UPI00006E7679|nr:exodeoxyribonuclease V subunit gamma [Psychromonas sp. CNPT3]AGH81681.1 exodeoxyribonuclease V subunit gamma [Psychromonas sp. CNPT3]
MFHVYHSNKLSLLKDLLLALIQQSPLENAFENETILVQSPGMAQWLQLEIAQETGIAANLDFPLPASFIWQQFKHVLDDVPESSPFNKMAMTWHIMQLLPQCLDDPDFSALQHYLDEDETCRKRFQLSQKIADIFDQYLVYRPQWIEHWDKHSLDEIALWDENNINAQPAWINEQRWQAKLWKKLSEKIELHFQEKGKAYHRAGLYQDFLSILDQGKSLTHLPKRLFVFGVSALPSAYLQALLGLSKHCEVHFLLTNPCRYYWADIVDPKLLAKRFAQQRQKWSIKQGLIEKGKDSSWQKDDAHRAWAMSGDEESEVGNPLLASMGKMGRDFLYQLYCMDQNEIDAFVDIERDSLLHHLQADILSLQDSSQALSLSAIDKMAIEADDTSLTVHITHTIMREVEVLHDNLLSMFAADSRLTPKDIIVMVPNIDQYAPYVQAVFNGVENNRYIPFTLSDVSAQQENPILVSFLQLLNLNQTRYTRENVLALLEVPAILARFNLTQSDFVILQKWIHESGIRWGLNAQSGAQWDLPEQAQNSWLFGLKRMLLGYAMGDALFEGILPYDEVEGSQGDLLGRFIDFIDALMSLETDLQQSYDAPQWQQFIYQLISTFYLEDDDNHAIFTLIRDQIDVLMNATEQAEFEQPIALVVLLEFFETHLSSQSNSQRFLTGPVNFCTLMPMRSIPFKVVCLLGMNDGVYPRSIVPMGFDLMAGHRQRGDRSRRDEDRYLFLEALLSAEQRLYISYIGRDVNDNSEKMASVLVSELLNYCQQSFVLKKDQASLCGPAAKNLLRMINHYYPMQSFSSAYYHGEMQTYDPRWWAALNAPKSETKDEVMRRVPLAEPLIEIALLHLKQFLKHPCKAFYNQRLDIYLDIQDSENEKDEPFTLDNLQQYYLKLQQFIVSLEGRPLENLYDELRGAGQLPCGEFGRLVFNKDKQQMIDLADITAGYYVGEIASIKVDLQFAEKHLSGELTDHCENGLVRVKTGNIKGKDILALWLDHLCYCITHTQNLNSILLGQGSGIYFEELPSDYAYQHLQELILLYEDGLQHPLPFFIESAYAWSLAVHSAEADCFVLDDLSFEARAQGQSAALDVFASSRGFSEGSDPYISPLYEHLDAHWLAFEALSFKVFKPLLSNMNQIEYDAE